MRIAVTGKEGQVALCLKQAGPKSGIEVILVGRPELDLADPSSVMAALSAARPDIIVSAAAFTAVDLAETESQAAFAINAHGAGAVAAAAKALDVPIIHLSTDYVFDGSKPDFYVEDDPVNPQSVYGRSKLEGEQLVAGQTDNHVILRTAWVYSPFGKNFLKTMMRLGQPGTTLRVVGDQMGCPTSAIDIAEAIIAIARRLTADRASELRGLFHLCGSGQASWADFAEFIFQCTGQRNGQAVHVTRIGTIDYQLPALRPANSRLCCDKLDNSFAIRLPDWKLSAGHVIDILMDEQEKDIR